MSNRAMLRRRYDKPWSSWWPADGRQQKRWLNHILASGDAWEYSSGHRQLIHKGRKP